MDPIYALTQSVLQNLDSMWTLILLLVRFGALIMVLPGIGGGERGMAVRGTSIVAIALACFSGSLHAKVPPDMIMMVVQVVSEVFFGLGLGMIPMLIIAAVQTGGQLASTSMGFNASNLMDPTSGTMISDIAKLLGDLAVIFFLMFDGHHAVFTAAAGLGGVIVPGTFFLSQAGMEGLVQQSAEVFSFAMMISAPVVVALLITQFVMGMISRAVPTINVFIISFPLTISVGLVIVVLSMPGLGRFMEERMGTIEKGLLLMTTQTQQKN
jgi:flagellar biosynthetic protein FliR